MLFAYPNALAGGQAARTGARVEKGSPRNPAGLIIYPMLRFGRTGTGFYVSFDALNTTYEKLWRSPSHRSR
jgi:hypothetical protein